MLYFKSSIAPSLAHAPQVGCYFFRY